MLFQILWQGLSVILDFGYFVLICWQSDKKQEILKWSCKDLFIMAKLPIKWLIIGSDNIFNIQVNGSFAIHIIVHNSLTQNQNLWAKILDDLSCLWGRTDISTYWCHRKMMLEIQDSQIQVESGNSPLKVQFVMQTCYFYDML